MPESGLVEEFRSLIRLVWQRKPARLKAQLPEDMVATLRLCSAHTYVKGRSSPTSGRLLRMACRDGRGRVLHSPAEGLQRWLCASAEIKNTTSLPISRGRCCCWTSDTTRIATVQPKGRTARRGRARRVSGLDRLACWRKQSEVFADPCRPFVD